MTHEGLHLLTSEHILDGFDCGKPALNGWLVGRGLGNQGTGTSRTWVITEGGSKWVVAFYSSSTASVLRTRAPKKFTRNQPEEIPAILLGRIAVDSRHQGEHLGSALLQHCMIKAIDVAAAIGVRLLLVHAKDEEAKEFYAHYGFVESPLDSLTMLALLPLDARQ